MHKFWHNLVWSLVLVLISGLLSGCDFMERARRRGPTAPHEAGLYAGFFASQSNSSTFGVYNGGSSFVIRVPPGEYLQTYRSGRGEFYVVFRAERSAFVHIGLQPGDEVASATLYEGRVTDTSGAQSFGVVKVYSELGARGSSWEALFRKDSTIPGRPLIGGAGVNYIPGVMLELFLAKAGRYLLTYVSNLDTVERTIKAPENNYTIRIDLQPGEIIQEAYLQPL
jgi:hypothetical protein